MSSVRRLALALSFLVVTDASATVYVLNVDAPVDLDGNTTTDIVYFLCGPNCPAISPRNGSGWAYGNNTGSNANAWTQQSYARAGAQTSNTPVGGFGFSGPDGYIYSQTFEVYLIKTSTSRYFKLRADSFPSRVDPFDFDPGTIEIEEVLPSANLGVTKTDSPDPVESGSNLVYTIAVSNAGPDTATNPSLSDMVPPGRRTCRSWHREDGPVEGSPASAVQRRLWPTA